MADIGIVKAGIRAATNAQTGPAAQKTRPSKFDDIRSQLAEKLTQDLKLPATKPLSDQQAATLETALRKRLTETVAEKPADLFATEMQSTRMSLEKLASSVNKMPESKASAPIRESLNSIETQYRKSADLITGMKGMDLPSLLKAQVQLYQVSENVQLLSKVVDQVSSGVKTILQTQVG